MSIQNIILQSLTGVAQSKKEQRQEDESTRTRWAQCAKCGVVKEFGKDFHKTQLGRGGRCLACKRGIRKKNLEPQQPLSGMIFTIADPRYAGRFDDKQGGDTIVTMERVKEAIAFNAELTDERVNMVVAHIGANGLSLETDRWERA